MAARELLRRRVARRTTLGFTQYTKPNYDTNWHHEVICSHLDAFVEGRIRRLMVFTPQRHGKSELVSRRLPAFIFGRDPETTVMGCSYGATLASQMNRDVQRIIDSPEYSRLFPETRLYGKNVRSTAQGSYLRNSDIFEIVDYLGMYRSAGVGGGITGLGFNYGIIDDPVKDPKDAESAVVRESLWDWYTGAFWTRQAPGACILLTMTRWHEDDLAGRLLKMAAKDPNADQWVVLKLPGVCEDETPEYERRREGEALWPERFDVSYFQSMRANSERQYQAMSQQNPTAREGSFFKVSQLEVVPVAPIVGSRVRFWDKAATEGAGDYTVGVRMARAADTGLFYIEDVVRGRWDTGERDRVIRQTAALDGMLVRQIAEEEGGSGGKDSARAFVQMLAGYDVDTRRASGSKELRADPLSAQLNAGNVKLVEGNWNRDFIEELRQFPLGSHDDQVDAASGAFSELTGVTGWTMA